MICISAIFISVNHPEVLLQRPTDPLERRQSIALSWDPDDSLWSSQRTICKSGANSPRPNASSKTARRYQQAKCQDKLLAAVKLSPSMSWHKLRKRAIKCCAYANRQNIWFLEPITAISTYINLFHSLLDCQRKPTWNLIAWYPHDYSCNHPQLFKEKAEGSHQIINSSSSWFSPGTPFWGNAKKSVELPHNHAQSGQGCTSCHPPTLWNWIGSCEMLWRSIRWKLHCG